MTCRELIGDFLFDLRPGGAEGLNDACRAHLASCTPCASYVASYRKTIELGREAFRHPANAPLEPELVSRILGESPGTRYASLRLRPRPAGRERDPTGNPVGGTGA